MNRFKKIVIGSALSFLLVQTAYADSSYCAPSTGAGIANESIKRMQEDRSVIEDMTALHKAETDAVNDTFSCSDVWSTPGVSVSFQNVVSLLKKAGEQAISKACSAAKDKITEATNAASQKASLNTSNIPGLSSLGMGTLGSISTGGSGVTVNGSNSTWNEISNNLK
ncbi:TPA: hypothetical protein ACQ2HY_003332 [Klebsiella pneumoniae]